MGSIGFVKLVSFEDVDFVVTDTEPEGELKKKFDEYEVQIVKI